MGKTTTTPQVTTGNLTPVTTPVITPASVVVTTQQKPQLRGNSTVPTPVAQVWVHCENICAPLRTQPNPVYPTRKGLVNGCLALGVTYYTARTQVQQYLKETQGGKIKPVHTPRYVVLNG